MAVKNAAERKIAELVPTTRDLYPASPTHLPVQLEWETGSSLATCVQISLEGMVIEASLTELPPREIAIYCEVPSVRASVEGHAVVSSHEGSRVALRFTQLTPQSALALRALTRKERLRTSPSTTHLVAPQVSRSAPPKPTITLSRLRAVAAPSPHRG